MTTFTSNRPGLRALRSLLRRGSAGLPPLLLLPGRSPSLARAVMTCADFHRCVSLLLLLVQALLLLLLLLQGPLTGT